MQSSANADLIDPPRIAVLMACHNRRSLTCACIKSLKLQNVNAEVDAFVVDDGSTDGTTESIRSLWTKAFLVQGNGELWWNGGMRLAWKTAKASGVPYEYYLWLNDDVVLRPGAVATLLADITSVQREYGEPAIIVGATEDPATGQMTYGGQVIRNPRRPLRMQLLEPNGSVQPCDTLSGNCVLVSASAERTLGNLQEDFEHIFGDLDYGIRAKKNGVLLFAGSRYVGACAAHSDNLSSIDRSLSRLTRIRLRLREERGIHARDWRRFVRLHSGLGPLSILYTLSPYLRILLKREHRY